MGIFNYQTNRIINGICEWCGISADNCEHYVNGQPRPKDYKDRLVEPAFIPSFRNVMVEPLKESEKVATMEEARKKMETYVAEEKVEEIIKPIESIESIESIKPIEVKESVTSIPVK